MDDLPESYYVGQEYVEDTNRIEAIISYFLYSNVFLSPFEFIFNDYKVRAIHNGTDFVILYERIISQKLFENVLREGRGKNFLYGYFHDILFSINTEISKQKYLSGHVLNRPISCFDVKEITVFDKLTANTGVIKGPLIFDSFPKAKELAISNDHIFIREYIDACTAYLYNNLDECIRKQITSLENFFLLHRFKGTFNQKLCDLLSAKYHMSNWSPYMNILISNMTFIYKLRNKIVHDELRVNYTHEWAAICDWGIGTLFYIYQNNLNKQEVINYIMSLVMQNNLIKNYTSCLQNLDRIEEDLKIKDNDIPILDTQDKIDKHMFQGLRIPEMVKQTVLNE